MWQDNEIFRCWYTLYDLAIGSAMSESWSDVYGYNARSELIWATKNAENAKEHALHVLHG